MPESERVKIRSFQAILDIAQAVPEDTQIINRRLNNLDLSLCGKSTGILMIPIVWTMA